MNAAGRTLGAFLLLSMGGASASDMQKVFSSTSGASCRDTSRDSFVRYLCRGPREFVVTFTDEGNLIGLKFGRTDGQHYGTSQSDLVWRGSGRSVGDKMGWLVDPSGRPVAAVLRTWEQVAGDRVEQSLKVFALNSGRACLFASISTGSTDADHKAAEAAAMAAKWRCTALAKEPGQ